MAHTDEDDEWNEAGPSEKRMDDVPYRLDDPNKPTQGCTHEERDNINRDRKIKKRCLGPCEVGWSNVKCPSFT